MNKNFLIVNANYYKDISSGLLKSAINSLPKNLKVKIINVPGVFEIVTGISNTPGTFIIFIFEFLGSKFLALFNKPLDISL